MKYMDTSKILNENNELYKESIKDPGFSSLKNEENSTKKMDFIKLL